MLGIRLDRETEEGLAAVARRTGRPKSQIARDAIRAYVARHDLDRLARSQWKAISDAERSEPSLATMLDGRATEISRDL